MPGDAPDQKSSRRSFLDLLLGASGAAWVASVLYPVIRYLKPLPRAGGVGPTRLSREELAKLKVERSEASGADGDGQNCKSQVSIWPLGRLLSGFLFSILDECQRWLEKKSRG